MPQGRKQGGTAGAPSTLVPEWDEGYFVNTEKYKELARIELIDLTI